MIGPVDGSIPSISVIVTESPFGSVSLPSRFVVAICPVTAAAKSSPAEGLSLTPGFGSAATLSVTVAVSVAPLGSMIE